MSATCPVCGSRNVDLQAAYRGQHPAFAGLHRAHCRDCQMVFSVPMPPPEMLEQYNGSYFTSAHGGKPRGAATLAFFSGIARLRVEYLENYLFRCGVPVRHVLEIGPGPGWFARVWRAQHPEASYRAVETDLSCHAALRELGVQLVPATGAPNASPPADLVVMTHVLEHVTDPAAFLRDATSALRPGGILFIEVPCRDWEHKEIDEPHLLFFDKAPMKLLLERMGFDQIQLTYHGRRIDDLRQPPSAWRRVRDGIRNRLLSLGVVAPFGRTGPGLASLSPLERAAVRSSEAQLESTHPAWWLRAVARKSGAPEEPSL